VDNTSQAVATAAPTSSTTQTSAAPNLVSPLQSSPSTYQASAPQVAPQAPAPLQQPQAYQGQVAPQASAATPAQTGNPWQEAFQALSASLNAPSQSLAQAPYSAYQTPTPQANTPAQWASTAPQALAQQAQQTYSAPASTPAYSEQQLAQMLASQQAAPNAAPSAPDAYLSQISDESLEVLEHFGAEAPALLNQYACAVEDALIEQVQRGQSLHQLLNAAGEERAAMNVMLTDPDVLAEYTNEFFGPEGPYPVETAEETSVRENTERREAIEADIAQQEQRGVPSNFQRPQMDMPTPGQQGGSSAANFWGDFSQLMDQNPEQAWQYLSQAPQGALQAKQLIQDV